MGRRGVIQGARVSDNWVNDSRRLSVVIQVDGEENEDGNTFCSRCSTHRGWSEGQKLDIGNVDHVTGDGRRKLNLRENDRLRCTAVDNLMLSYSRCSHIFQPGPDSWIIIKTVGCKWGLATFTIFTRNIQLINGITPRNILNNIAGHQSLHTVVL